MKFYKILICIFVIIILLALVFKSGFFNISHIELQKNNVNCINDQNFLSDIKLKSENIFLFNEKNINTKILLKFICVKNIIIEKKFPNGVKIILNERKGLARVSEFKSETLINLKDFEATSASSTALIDWSVSHEQNNENFILDNEGIIFAQSNDNYLPNLYIANQILQIGTKLKNIDFNKVSLLFNKLPQMNINITQVKINELNFQILSEPRIVFSLEKDVLLQLASLQLILDKAKIDNINMEIVDLRFDKPVVKYLPKK